MSDPTGGRGETWQERKARRQQVIKRTNAVVNETNAQLKDAREVLNDRDPRVKKLQADSVDAVAARSKAIKDYQEGI